MYSDFLKTEKPMITTMIQTDNPSDAISTIRNAIFSGTDAIGIQLEQLKPEYQNCEDVMTMCSYVGNRPIYITNYRYYQNAEKDDETLVKEIREYSKMGGGIIFDVMGDLLDSAPDELTINATAVEKQKQLIADIHANGARVLMSSHLYHYAPAERVLEIALEQQRRGADIAKIVTGAENDEEEFENLRITRLLKKELEIPFLFLSVGSHCKLHRMLSPILGSCMYLCVYEHDALSTKAQPVLHAVRQVLDHFDYLPDRKFDDAERK